MTGRGIFQDPSRDIPLRRVTARNRLETLRVSLVIVRTNDPIDRARVGDSTQVKTADRVLRVHAMVIRVHSETHFAFSCGVALMRWALSGHRR